MKVEVNGKFVEKPCVIGPIEITPPISEDYWLARVELTDTQAIVCFPKFSTIGIGFQKESDDWNTNLPYTSAAKEIYEHIECNKGDSKIPDSDCIAAIEALQEFAREREETQRRHKLTGEWGRGRTR